MFNYYYSSSIEDFNKRSNEEIIGTITIANKFDSTTEQNWAWEEEINILKHSLEGLNGHLFFEFSIPRMGKRVDTLLIINNVVFVIEFKVGETHYHNYNIEQVWDYALDLKNFHKPSHHALVVPVLVATEAKHEYQIITTSHHNDNLAYPIKTNKHGIRNTILESIRFFQEKREELLGEDYAKGEYYPTPTIIEAAISLYNNHTVKEITRGDAGAKNLTKTTTAISQIIEQSKLLKRKSICFVTGVPGAGKTLVGLNIATMHMDKEDGHSSVYLSGNGPLVAILQEALARDKISREKSLGRRITKIDAKQAVKTFIQNIHHYRDAYVVNQNAPYDHVAIFDEAQRAWNKEQTVKFMKTKKGKADFKYSEPEFLISCLDRHPEWAVVICLVGGGQEINTGEAGISEWINAIKNMYQDWDVYVSPNLTDSEYNAQETIKSLEPIGNVHYNDDLHLAVSMRSFRSERLSLFVKHLLDINIEEAQKLYLEIKEHYPIVITRDITKAKAWLKKMARGSERYGIVVSSQAERLKPLAIDVKSPVDPVHWFLDGKDDVRSSYLLEAVATEFDVQGLELDWACITWDGDLRYSNNGWQSYSFKGNKWQNINKEERKKYQLNAYRVLLTRARQGMVIVVPDGNPEDHTRQPKFYDTTYEYLRGLGLDEV